MVQMPTIMARILTMMVKGTFLGIKSPSFLLAMTKEWFQILNQGDVPVILIHGYIGPYDEVNYKAFFSAFKELEKRHKKAIMRFHSGGGDMIEGFAMHDLIANSQMETIGIVDGMAASMAGLLYQGATRRYINPNARIMTHRVKAGMTGESDQLRKLAETVDSFEDQAIKLYMKRTGQPESVVKTWFMPGMDKWFSAKEAVDMNLADGISDKSLSPESLMKIAPEPAGMKVYLNALHREKFIAEPVMQTTQNENNMSLKLKLISLLAMQGIANSLSDQDSDEKVFDTFKNSFEKAQNELKEKTDRLEAAEQKLKQINQARVTALIENAVRDGRITGADKAKWTERAEKDYETIADALGAMPGKADINNQLDKGKKGKEGKEAEDRTSWTFDDYSKKDPKVLAKMQTEDPDRFKELTEAKIKAVRETGLIG